MARGLWIIEIGLEIGPWPYPAAKSARVRNPPLGNFEMYNVNKVQTLEITPYSNPEWKSALNINTVSKDKWIVVRERRGHGDHLT